MLIKAAEPSAAFSIFFSEVVFLKEIKTVGLIGLGALGTLYSHLLTRGIGKDSVLVLADHERVRRYEEEGIFFNGERCDFNYVDAASCTRKLDLLLFCTKFSGLEDSIRACRHLVTPETTIVSVLNGISSEEVLGRTFLPQQIVWCIAQKMTAKKEGNRVTVRPVGELALGVPAGQDRSHLDRLAAFLSGIDFPHSLPDDIRTHMWSKLLCNVGTNQPTMVFQCGFGGLQVPGKPREIMFASMREVVAVANAEGIPLSEEDVRHWVSVVDSFPPESETSMRQDGKAHRKSEVDLFAGTIRRYAAKHGIPVPANDWLYEEVCRIEAEY